MASDIGSETSMCRLMLSLIAAINELLWESIAIRSNTGRSLSANRVVLVQGDMDWANQGRKEIASLGWDEHSLILQDIAVVVRHSNGSFTLNHEKLSVAANVLGSGCSNHWCNHGRYSARRRQRRCLGLGWNRRRLHRGRRAVEPGTSALFVLDDEGNMNLILHKTRGFGGSVLKTNAILPIEE